MRTIPGKLISLLIDFGLRPSEGKRMRDDVEKNANAFKSITSLHWSDWDGTTRLMPDADVIALFRGIILVEQMLGWSQGSVDASIWVFREIHRRNVTCKDEIADWALANTNNPYIPFGTQNFGAHSLAEYWRRSEEHQRSIKQGLEEVSESERRAQKEREKTAQQCRHAAELRHGHVRDQFLKSLETLSINEQLQLLANDTEFPIQWYPTRLACAANAQIINRLDHSLRMTLLAKLKGRHRGPWGNFKRRLRSSFGEPRKADDLWNRQPWFEKFKSRVD